MQEKKIVNNYFSERKTMDILFLNHPEYKGTVVHQTGHSVKAGQSKYSVKHFTRILGILGNVWDGSSI